MKRMKLFQLGVAFFLLISSQILPAQSLDLGDTFAEVTADEIREESVPYSIDPDYHGPTDRPAYFPGGMEGLQQFIKNNMHYPKLAQQNAIEGIVIVSIKLDNKGYIESPKILKSPGFNLDEEALRIVGQMPKWEPALQGGRATESKVKIAIMFRLR